MNQYNEISTLQYMGSKTRIISHICEPIIKNKSIKTVVDLFAGTGSVGYALKAHKNIISNDLECTIIWHGNRIMLFQRLLNGFALTVVASMIQCLVLVQRLSKRASLVGKPLVQILTFWLINSVKRP